MNSFGTRPPTSSSSDGECQPRPAAASHVRRAQAAPAPAPGWCGSSRTIPHGTRPPPPHCPGACRRCRSPPRCPANIARRGGEVRRAEQHPPGQHEQLMVSSHPAMRRHGSDRPDLQAPNSPPTPAPCIAPQATNVHAAPCQRPPSSIVATTLTACRPVPGAAAAERDVDVVAQEPRQRHVPAPPELADRRGAIRCGKVHRQAAARTSAPGRLAMSE